MLIMFPQLSQSAFKRNVIRIEIQAGTMQECSGIFLEVMLVLIQRSSAKLSISKHIFQMFTDFFCNIEVHNWRAVPERIMGPEVAYLTDARPII